MYFDSNPQNCTASTPMDSSLMRDKSKPPVCEAFQCSSPSHAHACGTCGEREALCQTTNRLTILSQLVADVVLVPPRKRTHQPLLLKSGFQLFKRVSKRPHRKPNHDCCCDNAHLARWLPIRCAALMQHFQPIQTRAMFESKQCHSCY
jgi:hypothetical protein